MNYNSDLAHVLNIVVEYEVLRTSYRDFGSRIVGIFTTACKSRPDDAQKQRLVYGISAADTDSQNTTNSTTVYQLYTSSFRRKCEGVRLQSCRVLLVAAQRTVL